MDFSLIFYSHTGKKVYLSDSFIIMCIMYASTKIIIELLNQLGGMDEGRAEGDGGGGGHGSIDNESELVIIFFTWKE